MRKFSVSPSVFAAIFVIALCLVAGYNVRNSQSELQPNITGPYKVLRVVDGDTIEIDYNGTKAKVRMLCIDTPESVHPDKSKNTPEGKVASDFTKERLTGRWIILEFEGKTKEDRYGRLLAYVHVNYNVELIHYGHSKYYTKYGKSARYDQIFTEAAK